MNFGTHPGSRGRSKWPARHTLLILFYSFFMWLVWLVAWIKNNIGNSKRLEATRAAGYIYQHASRNPAALVKTFLISCKMASMMYGSVLLWMWASVCLSIWICCHILCDFGCILGSFGIHLDVIRLPNGAPKRLGHQNGAGKLPGLKIVILGGQQATEYYLQFRCLFRPCA